MKFRSTSILAIFLFSLLLSSCDIIDDNTGTPNPTISILKKSIFQISDDARGQCDDEDNDPEVREKLNRLVNALTKIAPNRTEAEKLPQVLGVWKQVWSDSPFTGSFDGCLKADELYQIVFEDNFYYNISEISTEFASLITVGKGLYDDQGDFLSVIFDKNDIIEGELDDENPIIEELALASENGELEPVFSIPVPDETFVLVNVYVDDTLRIVADATNIDEASALFILKRQ